MVSESRQFNIQEADELGTETTSMFTTVNRIEREVQPNLRNAPVQIGAFPSQPVNSDPATRKNASKNFYQNMPRSSLNFTKKAMTLKQH